MSKTLLRHTLIKKYFSLFCRLPQCDTYAVCTLGHEAVSLWSCETGTRSNWSIWAMLFLRKMVVQGYNRKYSLIFKCHIAPVRHIHYITNDLYIFHLIITLNNIQLWPSCKVNIHNYQIEKEFFPECRWSKSKFNNDRYSLFRKSIMILLYCTKP
jgi:hypothetical protein